MRELAEVSYEHRGGLTGHTMDYTAIGMLAALCSGASWAVGSILFKKLGDELDSMAMTLVKGAMSIVLLAAAVALIGFEPVDRHALLLLVVSGLLGIAIADACFFESLKDIGPHALALLMTFGQVLTVIFAVIFLGERPTLLKWVGIALVVVGIQVVLQTKLTGEKKASGMRGLAFGLTSVVCMSLSFIVAKRGLESISAIEATLIRMTAGTIGMFVFGLATRRLGKWVVPFRDAKLVRMFLVSVCVVTFGGFWLSLAAFKYLEASIAGILCATEPLFVLPLAAVFLQEKVTLRAVVGTLVALIGICLICWRDPAPTETPALAHVGTHQPAALVAPRSSSGIK